jgi:hypothetical protein
VKIIIFAKPMIRMKFGMDFTQVFSLPNTFINAVGVKVTSAIKTNKPLIYSKSN